jgi:hypothetical protein
MLNTVGQTSYGEDIPLGQEREEDGVKKYWSGQNYGFQTKEQYQKLSEEGYFAGRTGGVNPIHETVFGGEAAARYISSGKEFLKKVARQNLSPDQRQQVRDLGQIGAQYVGQAIESVPGASESLEALDVVAQEAAKFLNIGKPQVELAADVLSGGAGKATGARKLGDVIPTPSPALVPAVATGTLARSPNGNIQFKAPTVMQINAQDALARGAYAGGRAAPGEAAQARTILNKELKGKPQSSIRGERAEMATDYSVTEPGLFIDQASEGAFYQLQYHHGADHQLVGDVGRAVGVERQSKILKLLQKNFNIRTGNDRFNMVFMHGGFDHQGLMHKRYYPQLSTRNRLEQVTKSGEIANWSDKRVAGLMQAAIKDQQEVIIGWGKWKLDAIKSQFPETAKMKAKELRDWVRDNPDLVSTAGKGTEPATADEIRKYGAAIGDVRNYNNPELREVWGIEFMNKKAAKGLAHEIPAIHRKRQGKTQAY